ncbi:MAG: class I SAM-dependent methyltransferase [Candidatus Peribacteria bacterium]|nr:class I SAM-dependent methyltransferase [Candidatus Peribacteria bacterium]
MEDFIQKYSNAIIVNLGSGLDTTFNRINNDKNKKLDLYNLDLPESIEFRKKYFGQEN